MTCLNNFPNSIIYKPFVILEKGKPLEKPTKVATVVNNDNACATSCSLLLLTILSRSELWQQLHSI